VGHAGPGLADGCWCEVAVADDDGWSLACDVSEDMQRRGGLGEHSEKLVAGLLWLLLLTLARSHKNNDNNYYCYYNDDDNDYNYNNDDNNN